jgi:hypothetical protein
MTLVWSSAIVEECGSWLKSIETFGWAVTARTPLSLPLAAAMMAALLISSTVVVARSATNLRSTQRDVRGRDADGDAVELALQRSGSTRPIALAAPVDVGIERQRGGAGAVEVLVHRVQRRLVAGVGMHRRHVAVVDADELLQHLGDRRQAVGRAGAVRDDQMVLGEAVMVDAVNGGVVGMVGRAPRR